MPANMRYNAVMCGSRNSQCHLANALGSLKCAEDKTCSKPALDTPHLGSMLSVTRNRHSKVEDVPDKLLGPTSFPLVR